MFALSIIQISDEIKNICNSIGISKFEECCYKSILNFKENYIISNFSNNYKIKGINFVNSYNDIKVKIDLLENNDLIFIGNNYSFVCNLNFDQLNEEIKQNCSVFHVIKTRDDSIVGLVCSKENLIEVFNLIFSNIKNLNLLEKFIHNTNIIYEYNIIETKNSSLKDSKDLEYAANDLFQSWINAGVEFDDINKVKISSSVRICPGAKIRSFVVLKGSTIIGKNTVISEFSSIDNSIIGEGCTIKSSTVLNSIVENNVKIGPYAYIRDNCLIKNNSLIGCFSEINNTVFGENSACKHLGYIGYSSIGSNVNIGAGVITCTYDGANKHRTIIKDNAFIGCGSLMITPTLIGMNSMTGSGSVITKEVKDNELVFGVPAKPH
ncbi:TPA: hypothetical protein PTV43_002974 [Clostridium botulinum]|nr:hypothetical protein [Clostridium botulinum]